MLLMLLAAGPTALGAGAPPAPRPLQPVEVHVRLRSPGNSNSASGLALPAQAPYHLTYFGGPVISNVKIIMVLYGSGTYGSYITNDAAPSMASFYQQVVNSSYIDWLCEYSTPSQIIGRGSYAGKVTITPSPENDRTNIDDTNIQAELARQIATGQLPTPDSNTLYMIHFPRGKSITSQGFGSCVLGGFCAYHSTTLFGSTRIYYAVLPDMSPGSLCNTGCGRSPLTFDNQCSIASHELIESITDPAVGLATAYGPPLGWYDYDPDHGINLEIADICDTDQTTFVGSDGYSYTVQRGWSNTAGSCIGSSLPPVANSQSVTNLQDTPVAIRLTGADPNSCPHPLSFVVTANPSHGTLSGAAPALTYTPAAGYSGPDSLQFKVNNGVLDSTPALVSMTHVPTRVDIARLPDGNNRISFAAIPGWPYEVQAADYLTNPIPWVTVLVTNAGPHTTLMFDDLTATNHQQRFYRPATP